jgi:hypothetical protein
MCLARPSRAVVRGTHDPLAKLQSIQSTVRASGARLVRSAAVGAEWSGVSTDRRNSMRQRHRDAKQRPRRRHCARPTTTTLSLPMNLRGCWQRNEPSIRHLGVMNDRVTTSEVSPAACFKMKLSDTKEIGAFRPTGSAAVGNAHVGLEPTTR